MRVIDQAGDDSFSLITQTGNIMTVNPVLQGQRNVVSVPDNAAALVAATVLVSSGYICPTGQQCSATAAVIVPGALNIVGHCVLLDGAGWELGVSKTTCSIHICPFCTAQTRVSNSTHIS